MLLVIQRDAVGQVFNAYPIADDDPRAGQLAATESTEVYQMVAGASKNVGLVRQRIKAGTEITKQVTTGGTLEVDPTAR